MNKPGESHQEDLAINRLLGGSLAAGIGEEVSFKQGQLPKALGHESFAQPKDLNKAEALAIQGRRAALSGVAAPEEAGRVMDAVALCLSGGGIRSATFSLGIVEVLARRGLFPQIDYLSTVSGGGYLGTFLTSFLGTPKPTAAPDERKDSQLNAEEIHEAIQEAFLPTTRPESRAVRHLRNHSRYLYSGGWWPLLKITAVLLAGILTNLLLFIPLALCAARALLILDEMGWWGKDFPQAEIYRDVWQWGGTRLFLWFAGGFGVFWFILPLVRNLARGAAPKERWAKIRSIWEVSTIFAGACTVLLGALLGFPGLLAALHWIHGKLSLPPDWQPITAGLGVVAPFALGLLAAGTKEGWPKKIAIFLFTLSGPLLYTTIILMVTHGVLFQGFDPAFLFAGTAFLMLWGYFFVDINGYSPHIYYRNRLCDCYLAVRSQDETPWTKRLWQTVLHGRTRQIVSGQPEETLREDRTYEVGVLPYLPLSQMNDTGAAPYHLIHSAVNLPASADPNLRGRDCDFFSFSKDYCGGPVCGYIPTATCEQLDRHIDLGSAMAISGAAASANMGLQTMTRYRFLLALLNVRLGYWLRNAAWGKRNFLSIPGPLYLLLEMLGWMHEKWAYLNISDGGHIENLALYEMLRRRCKLIIAVDGGMEPGMECADLRLVQRYARIDLGTEIEIDLSGLVLGDAKRTKAYASFGQIHYWKRKGDTAPPVGWLIYLKLACTGREPGDVEDYRRRFPDFPHQSTSDQLYDEAQFEAYRRLGECAAESLFAENVIGSVAAKNAQLSMREWFAAMIQQNLTSRSASVGNQSK